jgi:hypothetical protein
MAGTRMVKENARTSELMRRRARQRRSTQLWLGVTVAWAGLIGWVLWGVVNTLTDSSMPVWVLVYLLPVLVLGGITVAKFAGMRGTDREIVDVAEQAAKARKHGP